MNPTLSVLMGDTVSIIDDGENNTLWVLYKFKINKVCNFKHELMHKMNININ